jgi:hypothetical protein
MSSITADGLAAADRASAQVGPLEQKHLQYANYRAVAGPVLMVAMAIGVTMMVPEHSGKELNEIIV